MNLLLGTKNEGKIRELRELLADLDGITLLTLSDRPFHPVEETGSTFLENALLKARAICSETKLPVLAEDAGLEVVALEGAPGIHSARYAGIASDYSRNNALLLKRLAGIHDRRARFLAVAALRLPDGRETFRTGILTGRITGAPVGENGFGYDPLFIPSGCSKTLAEMTAADKNRISHRHAAIKQMKPFLRQLVQEDSSVDGRVF